MYFYCGANEAFGYMYPRALERAYGLLVVVAPNGPEVGEGPIGGAPKAPVGGGPSGFGG